MFIVAPNTPWHWNRLHLNKVFMLFCYFYAKINVGISHPAWRWSECQRLKVLIDDEFDGFLFFRLNCWEFLQWFDTFFLMLICLYCLRRILITSYSILKTKPSAITFVNQIIIKFLPNYTSYGSSTCIRMKILLWYSDVFNLANYLTLIILNYNSSELHIYDFKEPTFAHGNPIVW